MARYIIDETGVESRPPRKTYRERFMLPSKPLFETMVFDGSFCKSNYKEEQHWADQCFEKSTATIRGIFFITKLLNVSVHHNNALRQCAMAKEDCKGGFFLIGLLLIFSKAHRVGLLFLDNIEISYWARWPCDIHFVQSFLLALNIFLILMILIYHNIVTL